MSVEIYGTNKLMARLARMKRAMDPAVAKVFKKIAIDIKDTAKRLVPVDTGSLQRSIRVQRFARPKKHFYTTGVSAGGYITNPKSNRKVDYASFIEFGTSKQYKQPFLRPALEQHKHKFPKQIKRLIKE